MIKTILISFMASSVLTIVHAAGHPDVIAHWSFDDAPVNGIYSDDSTNGKDLTITRGTIHNTNDLIFGSGSIDIGAEEYLTLSGGLPLIKTSFSACFWVKRNTIDVHSYVAGMSDALHSGGLHIGFRPDNVATIDFWDDGLCHSDTFATTDTESWHHYAFTYDARTKQQRIIIDGNLREVATRTASNDFLGIAGGKNGTTDDFWIGKSLVSTLFDGTVDEVWIFNKALSDNEVMSLYYENQLPVTLGYRNPSFGLRL
jgi:hypothetical protein